MLISSNILGCVGPKEVNMPIVLFTDYGVEDYRIAQLKGIIYSINPQARVIDASHSVAAFDIAAGAFMLDVAATEFPENVVFIAIIAPYTPPATEYVVLTTNKDQIFVLPDNGLISYVARNQCIKTLYRVTDEKLFNEPMKDLVADRIQGKIGALVAAGYKASDLGVPATKFRTLDIQEPAISDNKLMGTIAYIDHYGNAVTNIPAEIANEFGVKPGDPVQVKILQNVIPGKYGTIYSDVPEGENVVFICNNLDMLQLSINLGSFADTYGVKAGTKIELEK